MNPKIICFLPYNSPRLTYILNIFFSELLNLKLSIIEDEAAFLIEYQAYKSENYYFFYAAELPFPKFQALNIPFYKLSSFLFEKTINKDLKVEMSKWHNLPIGFNFGKGDMAFVLSFDLFAWCFYLLSRYEEYTAKDFDQHGRFSAKSSLAYEYDFLHLPLIELLAQKYAETILNIKKDWSANYAFRASYDIDYMFAFLAKGWKRQMAAAAKNLLQGDFKQLAFKWRVFSGKAQDPFYTFDYMNSIHEKYEKSPYWQNPAYFMLIGNWGEYDKNIHWQAPKYKEVLSDLAQKYTIGLHPSYQSNHTSLDKGLKMEQDRLAHFIPIVNKSRQHFVKLTFPSTYQNLLAVGIVEDYSMGYADALGFRASIASPFYWYDLSKEEATNLKVYPFAIMDVTLKNYLKLSPQAAKNEIEQYILLYKKIGALFIPLWHNSSLGDWEGWGEAWRGVYEFLFEKAMD